MYKIVHLTDVHIGHPKVSTAFIDQNLKTHFFPHLLQANVLFGGGDFFNHLLRLDATNTQLAILLISDLLTAAKSVNCTCRFLRGTYSHDRDQNSLFDTINQHIGADVKCINTLSLEYLECIQSRVLYIPDNLPYQTTEDCLVEIRNLLDAVQWDKVDIVICHGYFRHVLPPGIPREPHCTFGYEDFKNIVKHFIVSGHVHKPSIYKNVYYGGSFDRLAHGEEEAKGFLYFTGSSDTKWKHTVVENTTAMKFITIRPIGSTIPDLIESCKTQVELKFGVNVSGYLKIVLSNPDYRQILIHHLSTMYGTNLVIVGESGDKTIKNVVPLIDAVQLQDCTYPVPTNDNLPELTLEWLKSKSLDKGLTLEVLSSRLQEI